MGVGEIVLATQNKDKLAELRSLMRGSRVRVFSLASFGPMPAVKEDGRTFEANARKKARAYSRRTDRLTLADDSGLSVRALNGKPGVYSARFAGPGCTYADNNRKLLRLLGRKPRRSRRAAFVCVVALYYRGMPVGVVRGECAGEISFAARGENGFGYDPVFIPNGHRRTFAELGRGAKNRISHRGRALKKAKLIALKFLRSRR